MRNKKKFIPVIFFLFGFSFTAFAQDDKTPYMAGLTIEVPVFPLGDFTKTNTLGYGFGAYYELGLSEKVSATIGASYLHFGGVNSQYVRYPGVYQVPIQVGAKYYFYAVHYGLYLKAEAGLHFYQSYDIQNSYSSDLPESKTGSGPGFAPSFGVVAMNGIDLNVRYQVVSVEGTNLSYISIKIIYVFAQY